MFKHSPPVASRYDIAASTRLPVRCPVKVFARTKLAVSPYPPTKASPKESQVSAWRMFESTILHWRLCTLSEGRDAPGAHTVQSFLQITQTSMSRNEEVSQATKGDDSVTWNGSVKLKIAPPPLLALAHNCPPCDSTMERLMANPMPLPCGLVVKNAEKI